MFHQGHSHALAPILAKKLLDTLQTDLRQLSSEAKRKFPSVKEHSETALLKVRTIVNRNENEIIPGLQSVSTDLVRPFIMGCETKHSKLVQIGLSSIQKLISHEVVAQPAAESIINMLWLLMETGTEELKVLQTALLLITTNSVVQHDHLAKALVLCFRLHFTKDSTTINTAAATIKQLVNVVFERVVIEDNQSTKVNGNISFEDLKIGSKTPPKSLQPCAGDAYLLFQDLCQLVNADQPYWLVGMTEMTRTFGLELLESVLTTFSNVFLRHPEFSFMLKERVCPLVIKLFSPSLKYRQGVPPPPSPAPVEKPFFPIVMRLLRIVSVLIKYYYQLLVTECEIFLSLLVKFLEPEKPSWQRCLTLEVLHKLTVQPELLRSFCESYDMKPHSTKIFRDLVNAIGSFIQSMFLTNITGYGYNSHGVSKGQDMQGTPPALVGGLPVGSGVSPQPAFMYRGIWIPFILTIPQGQTKSVFLEMLDKIEPPPISEGYGLSLAFHCLMEIVKSVQFLIEGGEADDGKEEMVECKKAPANAVEEKEQHLHGELINSSWCGMLASLSLLLDASTDESATESILKSQQIYASLCGKMSLNTARDAFITALCKASLPPHYALTILNTNPSAGDSNTAASPPKVNKNANQDAQSVGMEAVERSQVVVVGTALPTASLPVGAHVGPVMLTAKNIQCMRALLSVAHCHGGILGTAWHLVLTTLQHLVWILGLKPSTGGSLKAGQQINDVSNAVITTAIMADLPVLSAMLSRLFESSQYLDDVALHHLIDALCKLSSESMELAYSNREPSLFAVAKLLETGLVNLSRVEVLWKPVTAHLLESSLKTFGIEQHVQTIFSVSKQCFEMKS
ncbi:protein MON2 homolog isoform X2 [Octopus vulgaris]|uniref:Protein MON2 homolog isoform X2 n=1 Tax=Octopus vulgaris TaxID=6645 RepID=A0AA36B913_OCTVU|nr:protein MON2 homolog isoform X2 [Octopus vulgaris]